MKQHERRAYWTMIAILAASNALLLVAIWFVNVEQLRHCQRDGVIVLSGQWFRCEVSHD